MGLESGQEFSAEQRERFEERFRFHSRVRRTSFFGGILFYLGFLLAGTSAGFWDDYWGVAFLVLLTGTAVCLHSLWNHSRCPACNHYFHKRPPNRTRKLCPACGSQLIN